jgi:hypothetical protein
MGHASAVGADASLCAIGLLACRQPTPCGARTHARTLENTPRKHRMRPQASPVFSFLLLPAVRAQKHSWVQRSQSSERAPARARKPLGRISDLQRVSRELPRRPDVGVHRRGNFAAPAPRASAGDRPGGLSHIASKNHLAEYSEFHPRREHFRIC